MNLGCMFGVGTRRICSKLSWTTRDQLFTGNIKPTYLLLQIVAIFDVQFMKCFNVFIDEGNRNNDKVFDSSFCVPFHSIICLRRQPLKRSNFGLPDKSVGILELQLVHHSQDCGSNFRRIRVSTINHLRREARYWKETRTVLIATRKSLSLSTIPHDRQETSRWRERTKVYGTIGMVG